MSWGKVFIIGNGFDLSLGWPTRYSDFAKSKYWPFNDKIGGLGAYLSSKFDLDKWLDIELEMLKYAMNEGDVQLYFNSEELIPSEFIKSDKNDYETLTTSLTNYLTDVQKQKIKENSAAARVLRAISVNGYFKEIYTFNYTNLGLIAKSLRISDIDKKYRYVHGSLENNDIIIGIDDHKKVMSGYDFMYKTFNKNYQSSPIQYSLQEANEVVFFGVSFGEADFHYFQDFFGKQSLPTMTKNDKKTITIFTFDDESRLDILRKLRAFIPEKSLDLLFSNNDFKIICTKEKNEKNENDLNTFVKRLEENSAEKRFGSF